MEHEKFEGERTLMRIHIGESDRWEGKPLYEALVELFRHEPGSAPNRLEPGQNLYRRRIVRMLGQSFTCDGAQLLRFCRGHSIRFPVR